MTSHFRTRSSRTANRKPRTLRLEAFEDRRTPAALFVEDFSDNSALWNAEGNWSIAPAVAGTIQGYGNPDPGTDHTPTTDNGVAGVMIGGNFPLQITPMKYLTSPVINTAGQDSATLDYQRWLNVYEPAKTPHTVDVFDGTTWRNLYTASGPTAEGAWNRVAHDLTPYRNDAMRVRFGYGVVNTSVSFLTSGWNVDDVTIGRMPVTFADTVLANPTGPRTFLAKDLVANDTDADGDLLIVNAISTTTVKGGTVSMAGGIITYNPPAGGLKGEDSFFYTAREPSGLSSTGKVTMKENMPPMGIKDSALVEPGSVKVIAAADLLANDRDLEGGALTITGVDAHSRDGASVLLDGTNILYLPRPGGHDLDDFEYSVSDSLGLTGRGRVEVRVNAAPVAGPDAYAVPEDGKLVVPTSSGVRANDTDAEKDGLRVAIVSQPAHGTLVLKSDGAFDYTPVPNYHGTDSFLYTVSDAFHTVTGTVTLIVTSVVDVPSVPFLAPISDMGLNNSDGVTTARSLQISGTTEAGARVTVRTNGAVLGTTTANSGGAWSYTTLPLDVGPHSLTVTAADAAGNVSPESAARKVVIVGAPTARIATVASSGTGLATVAVSDSAGNRLFDLVPGWLAANGTRLSTGDITGDGVADLVATPRSGSLLGTVFTYDGATGAELFRQTPIGFGAKTAIALGDLDADGHADLVAAGLGGTTAGRIVGLSGKTNLPLINWGKLAGTTVHGVQTGDVDGDLFPEVWVHQTQKGKGTDVVAFNVSDRSETQRFDGKPMKLVATDRFAVRDVSGDGIADLIVGTAAGKVTTVNGSDATQLGTFAAEGGGKGARGVAAADVTGDGVMDIIVGAVKSGKSDGLVRVTDATGLNLLGPSLAPFGPNFRGGIEV